MRWKGISLVGAGLVLVAAGGVASAASEPTIETIAGGPVSAAPAAGLAMRPTGLAYGPDGSLFVGDASSDLLWRIGEDGPASIIAGDGRPCLLSLAQPGSSSCFRDGGGDGGLARLSHLVSPGSVAVTPEGDVFVAEPDANDVRRIDGDTGIITTALGNGETAYDPDLHEGVPGSESAVSNPQSLAAAADGSVYLWDAGNKLVRRLHPNGTVTVALGCMQCTDVLRDRARIDVAYLSGVQALAIDAAGGIHLANATGIFWADVQANQYKRMAGDTFAAGTQPGQGEGGPADDARFKDISQLAFAPDGSLLVLDRAWSRLRRIDAPVSPASTVRHAGGGGGPGFGGDGGDARDAQFAVTGEAKTPGGLAVGPDGVVAIGDVNNGRVRTIDEGNVVRTLAGSGISGPVTRLFQPNDFQPTLNPNVRGGYSGDGGPATAAQLWGPSDVVVDPGGNVYVADAYAHRVRRIDAATGTIATVVGAGCAGKGCTISNTAFGDGGPAVQATLNHPVAIALSRDGTQLFISDHFRHRVRRVNMGSSSVTAYPSPSAGGAPITIPPGQIATVYGTGSNCSNVVPECGEGRFATAANVSFITGLALDAAGNLYVADNPAQQVRRIDAASGLVRTVAGVPFWSVCEGRGMSGPVGPATLLCGPSDLEVGPDGALYVLEGGSYGFGSGIIADQSLQVVRRIDLASPAFGSSIVVGGGAAGPGGDGGPATEAQLGFPNDLAFGPDGSMFIADTGNSRIRRVKGGTITTVAGNGAVDGTVTFSGGYLASGMTGCGHAGDGGPAAFASLCGPMGVAVSSDGTVLVADQLNNRIRAIRGL